MTYLSQLVARRRLQILLNFKPWISWKKEENLICKAHLKHGGQNTTDPQSMENLRGYYFERVLWKELLFIYTYIVHTYLCVSIFFHPFGLDLGTILNNCFFFLYLLLHKHGTAIKVVMGSGGCVFCPPCIHEKVHINRKLISFLFLLFM